MCDTEGDTEGVCASRICRARMDMHGHIAYYTIPGSRMYRVCTHIRGTSTLWLYSGNHVHGLSNERSAFGDVAKPRTFVFAKAGSVETLSATSPSPKSKLSQVFPTLLVPFAMFCPNTGMHRCITCVFFQNSPEH